MKSCIQYLYWYYGPRLHVFQKNDILFDKFPFDLSPCRKHNTFCKYKHRRFKVCHCLHIFYIWKVTLLMLKAAKCTCIFSKYTYQDYRINMSDSAISFRLGSYWAKSCYLLPCFIHFLSPSFQPCKNWSSQTARNLIYMLIIKI